MDQCKIGRLIRQPRREKGLTQRQLAEKLKIYIVAEGIETEKQLDFLRRVRCGMVQGYVFSKPLAPEEFDEWRRKRAEKKGL